MRDKFFWMLDIGWERNGWCFTTSYHCAKLKPIYSGYRPCHLALLTSFGARDGALVIRQQSYWIKFPLKHPPTQSQTRHNCQSQCFILFLYHHITETKLMRKMDANINQYDKTYFKLHLWGNLFVVYSEFSVRPRSSWNNWGETTQWGGVMRLSLCSV